MEELQICNAGCPACSKALADFRRLTQVSETDAPIVPWGGRRLYLNSPTVFLYTVHFSDWVTVIF